MVALEINSQYADYVLKNNIFKILSSGVSDESFNVRPKWADGTPAHTKYLSGSLDVYRISEGEFPLTTLRPVAWKTALKELLWIYQDKSNNIDFLFKKYGVKYWEAWKQEDGTLGKGYGYQIAQQLDYPEGKFNQVERVIYLLKNDPMNRRIMTNMISFPDMKDMTLVPCAFMTMWTVREDFLDMTLIQRSNDLVAANSINAVQYAMLLMMVAATTGYKAGHFTHFVQNIHIYDRHMEIAREMLERPSSNNPLLEFKPESDFSLYTPESFTISNYNPGPQVKFEIAI